MLSPKTSTMMLESEVISERASSLEMLQTHSFCSTRDGGALAIPTDPKHPQCGYSLHVVSLCVPRLKHTSQAQSVGEHHWE